MQIGSPAPSIPSASALTLDSKTDVVGANIDIDNLRVDIDIDGSGLVPDCGLRLTADTMTCRATTRCRRTSPIPTHVDVNLVDR